MTTTTETDPRFVMKLAGTHEVIAVTAERLRFDFGAEVVIITRGQKSRLTARVPQDRARDAMREILGLP